MKAVLYLIHNFCTLIHLIFFFPEVPLNSDFLTSKWLLGICTSNCWTLIFTPLYSNWLILNHTVSTVLNNAICHAMKHIFNMFVFVPFFQTQSWPITKLLFCPLKGLPWLLQRVKVHSSLYSLKTIASSSYILSSSLLIHLINLKKTSLFYQIFIDA